MNYKIQAVETIELKRSVGTVDFERIEELGMGKHASFAEIANVYDGGKIKFLQNWADAIDDIETSNMPRILAITMKFRLASL